MSFPKNLAQGKAGENLVVQLFEKFGFQVIPKHKLSYDLAIQGFVCSSQLTEFTAEVKCDLKSSESGNIALEIFNPVSCKLSGIYSTRADLWFIVTKDEIWVISVSLLREIVGSIEPLRIVKKGGDGNATLYLYSTDVLLPMFDRIDHLSKEQFGFVLRKHLCIK